MLDANVFIEAKKHYYAFDIAPGFWQTLSALARGGQIHSIDRIEKQLTPQMSDGTYDELAQWIIDGNMNGAFVSSDNEAVGEAYAEIMKWVQDNPQFSDDAKFRFANDPDGWLIAYAKVRLDGKNYVVVTHERLDMKIERKAPIPNICQAFNIEWITTFEMLRRLGIQFKV